MPSFSFEMAAHDENCFRWMLNVKPLFFITWNGWKMLRHSCGACWLCATATVSLNNYTKIVALTYFLISILLDGEKSSGTSRQWLFWEDQTEATEKGKLIATVKRAFKQSQKVILMTSFMIQPQTARAVVVSRFLLKSLLSSFLLLSDIYIASDVAYSSWMTWLKWIFTAVFYPRLSLHSSRRLMPEDEHFHRWTSEKTSPWHNSWRRREQGTR